MNHALSDPVNLITEIDEYSTPSCIRRVMARILGHAGLDLADAREIWVSAGFDPDLWQKYVPTIRAV